MDQTTRKTAVTIDAKQFSKTTNWDLFRYLLAVAKTGSFSGAAKAMGESQPTVGRKIRDLERDLSTALIERSASGVTLTEAGQGILALIGEMEATTFAILDHVHGNDHRLEGKVTVTAPEGFGTAVLVPEIVKFHKQHPAIDLALLLGATRLRLTNGEADIALRIGDPVNAALSGRRAGHVAMALYASQDYLSHFGQPGEDSPLDEHRLIDGTIALGATGQSEYLQSMAAKARWVFQTNNLQAQMLAAEAGIGIAALPRYLARQRPGLVELPSEEPIPGDDMWILTRNEIKRRAVIRAAMDFLIEICQTALD